MQPAAVKAVGLADYGKAGNYFERQIGRWSKQYLASVTGSQPTPWTACSNGCQPTCPPGAQRPGAKWPSCTATSGWTT